MKITLINVIKPQEGSGDGMTEYTYEIYRRIKKKNHVEVVYATEKSGRVDVSALVYANTLFKLRIRKLAREDYDVIHITNQELGFAAKILKENGTRAAVVTTIHDVMRTQVDSYKGLMQRSYSRLVANSIRDSIRYSDYLIFSSSSAQNDTMRVFGGVKKSAVTPLAATEEFRVAPIPKKAKRKEFIVGYVGALASWKNPIFVLKTAELLKNYKGCKFRLNGNGPEEESLKKYKTEHGLDNVKILGFPSWDRFLAMYDSFDLFLYPPYEEGGSSLPLLNSQCRGLPVIVHKRNQFAEEVTRYCFPAKDEADAARIIKRIREKGFDKKHQQKMLRHARSFSWDAVTKQSVDAYRKALQH